MVVQCFQTCIEIGLPGFELRLPGFELHLPGVQFCFVLGKLLLGLGPLALPRDAIFAQFRVVLGKVPLGFHPLRLPREAMVVQCFQTCIKIGLPGVQFRILLGNLLLSLGL